MVLGVPAADFSVLPSFSNWMTSVSDDSIVFILKSVSIIDVDAIVYQLCISDEHIIDFMNQNVAF